MLGLDCIGTYKTCLELTRAEKWDAEKLFSLYFCIYFVRKDKGETVSIGMQSN